MCVLCARIRVHMAVVAAMAAVGLISLSIALCVCACLCSGGGEVGSGPDLSLHQSCVWWFVQRWWWMTVLWCAVVMCGKVRVSCKIKKIGLIRLYRFCKN